MNAKPSMNLPAFASFPPIHLREQISTSEWETFLEFWTLLVRAYLSLPAESLACRAREDNSQLFSFLASVLNEAGSRNSMTANVREVKLQRLCFLLVKRLVEDDPQQAYPVLGDLSFIGDFCLLYKASNALNPLMEKWWFRQSLETSPRTLKNKANLIQILGEVGKSSSEVELSLRRLVATLKACPSYGRYLLQGSDFFDALINAWEKSTPMLRDRVTAILYYSLISLLHSESSNDSLLLDHLYSLNAHEEGKIQGEKSSALMDLLCNTTFLTKLRSCYDKVSSTGRSKYILKSLESIEAVRGSDTKKLANRKISGKKSKGQGSDIPRARRRSLVTEIQDLFPTLTTSTIVELLDSFSDDTERVIAHILDGQQALEGGEMGRLGALNTDTELADLSSSSQARVSRINAAPLRLPARKNIFDNDELDNLEVAASRLHVGRMETKLEPSSAQNKAAIYSALAAFDSGSDERDDTYDIDDVGGAIDSTQDTEFEELGNEETLYLTWKSSPEVFARDAATRRGKARISLRSETGMADEAIEGWALILGRDPRRQAKLEAKCATFRGQQTELGPTAWRAAKESEDIGVDATTSDAVGGNRGRQHRRGQGRGGGGRGTPGGNVAGLASERDTQVARQRKDANKSSRANHNRRSQRARKVARAGFPG